MNLSGLLPIVHAAAPYKQLIEALNAGQSDTTPLSVYSAARPYLIAALARDLGRTVLVLVARSEQARRMHEELQMWLPPSTAAATTHLFADPDSLPFERIPWSRETRQRRLGALASLARSNGAGVGHGSGDDSGGLVVIASARALMQKTLPPRELRLSLKPLRVGQGIDLARTLNRWLGYGYQTDSVVEEVGQISRRGGIVDIWPPNMLWPVRIELFGDEIDSLRLFDPTTQRTIPEARHVKEVLIGPASEALPRLGASAEPRLSALDVRPLHPPARYELDQQREQLKQGTGFRGQEWYIPYLYSQPGSIFDFLPQDAFVFVDDGAEFMTLVTELEAQAAQTLRDLTTGGELPGNPLAPHFDWQALKTQLEARRPLLIGHGDLEGRPAPAASRLARHFAPGPRFGGKVRHIASDLEKKQDHHDASVVVTRQAQRLADVVLEEVGQILSVEQDVLDPPENGAIRLVKGVLSEGWVLRGLEGGPNSPDGLHLFSDAELFGWGKPRRRRAKRPRAMAPEAFFADVSPGDYVVHMEHGIGRFTGLVRLALDDGSEREYLQIDYAQSDRLYVPVHQADRLSRYVGAGEHVSPILHRLGTADWERVKKRTRKAVDDIADDLLELYSARELARGHRFSPDGAWQVDLEAAFAYEETNDQLVAIEAVKHDMESSTPMDRLICGDVGYGKTEVALRAAFKAVMDGKQVAILVPTTVLAQQHFETFSKRLAPFPVAVEMLSRFRTSAQQRKVIRGLVNGTVDIVIGTHRLLSRDVAFKDLGLLVVDEEQRFGVSHKERIKKMRHQVDVLTLTATPIPRTLHMSMTGVRDMSTIETPPEERLPIQTMIAEYDETLIRQAVLREVDRGGQVFFVHNRVRGISQIARRLERIIPEASFAIAHGQMPERELERVMLDFSGGEFNVLVCTTIIESGLDIPNANTIIINRADRFGLAQLYQLRGRVGRAAVRAYAYMLYDKNQTLTPVARDRLTALQEASELGAGFRIAMRDLEIRGAGELLGKKQHGHIAAVGFDLYCRLLAKSVEEIKKKTETKLEVTVPENPVQEEKAHERSYKDRFSRRVVSFDDLLAPAVTLDLPLLAIIPDSYVENQSLRLRLYRRIAGVTATAEIDTLSDELLDRFGPMPQEVKNLLYQVRIKILALSAGVTAIGRADNQLVLKSDVLEQVDRQRLQQRLSTKARVGRRAVWLTVSENWQEALEDTLRGLFAADR
ncbi:MAG: transcription-repair coupling factor [Chloroflexota bacterium]|nr:transcription-repair coupling factor [Chloroflexota bacterium]